MKRQQTKIGDIFSVKINEKEKKYFQLVAFDLSQLNSDVIRVFLELFPIDSNPDLIDIINKEVEFYAHCVTKLGLKLELWEKVGNNPQIGDTSKILFRDTDDYGNAEWDVKIKVSKNWYVWKINEDFKDVGELKGKNREADIGIIVTPYDIVERMKTGRYSFYYPDYE